MILKIENGNQQIISYPRADKLPIIGLDSGIEMYVIKKNIPEHDPETQYIIEQPFVLTDEFDSEYKHLKIAVRNYQVLSKEPQIDPTTAKITALEDAIVILAKDPKTLTSDEKATLTAITTKITLEKSIKETIIK